MRCFTYEKPQLWNTWLPWAEHWYNTTFHASTNTTSFRAVYGRDPHLLIRYGTQTIAVYSVKQHPQDGDAMLEKLKAHLTYGQAKMKLDVDGHR